MLIAKINTFPKLRKFEMQPGVYTVTSIEIFGFGKRGIYLREDVYKKKYSIL